MSTSIRWRSRTKVANPFSRKAGLKPRAGKNPFSVRAGVNGNKPDNERNRSTPKSRAATLRKVESAKARPVAIKNPGNPWVSRAYDVSQQVEDIKLKLTEADGAYVLTLEQARKAKTVEDITAAYNRSDRAMAAVLTLSQQLRALTGGIR